MLDKHFNLLCFVYWSVMQSTWGNILTQRLDAEGLRSIDARWDRRILWTTLPELTATSERIGTNLDTNVSRTTRNRLFAAELWVRLPLTISAHLQRCHENVTMRMEWCSVQWWKKILPICKWWPFLCVVWNQEATSSNCIPPWTRTSSTPGILEEEISVKTLDCFWGLWREIWIAIFRSRIILNFFWCIRAKVLK